MKYTVVLNNGIDFTLNVENLITNEFVEGVNDSNIQFFNIGELVINKQELMYMHPVDEQSEARAYNVMIRGGKTLKAYDDNFNVSDLMTKLNDRSRIVVAVGNTIVNTHLISVVVPA